MYHTWYGKMLTAATIFTVASLCLIQNIEAKRPLTSLKVGTVNSVKGREPFVAMPTTTRDEGIEAFQKVRPERGFRFLMDIYCLRQGHSFCLLFDKKGNVVGVQISYLKSDVEKIDSKMYNYSNPNFVLTNFFNKPAYTVRVYFVKPDELTAAGRNTTSEDIIDGLWAYIDGELVRFDYRCQPNSPKLGEHFYRQGCGDMTGLVYSRDFHENSECTNAFWLYLLFDQGSLIGFGHAGPGIELKAEEEDLYTYAIRDKNRQELIPYPPPCFFEMVKYDFRQMSIFFIEDPWNIRCRKCHCFN